MSFARGQISRDGRQWHLDFADAIASRDAARYTSFMREDCSVQVNNEMPVYSKQAIALAFAERMKGFRSMSYELMNAFGTDSHSVVEALFNYVCHDGTIEVVQHAYICERDEAGLLTCVRVYGDTSRIPKPVTVAND